MRGIAKVACASVGKVTLREQLLVVPRHEQARTPESLLVSLERLHIGQRHALVVLGTHRAIFPRLDLSLERGHGGAETCPANSPRLPVVTGFDRVFYRLHRLSHRLLASGQWSHNTRFGSFARMGRIALCPHSSGRNTYPPRPVRLRPGR